MLRRIILRDPTGGGWLLFEDPHEILAASVPTEIAGLMEELEVAQASADVTAAGYIAYEAAPGFDPSFKTRAADSRPVACFGLFPPPRRLAALPSATAPASNEGQWTLLTGRDAYAEKIEAIKRQIALGNTYQVNLTLRLEGHVEAGGWPLFRRIAGEAPYSAWLDFDEFAVVSASPELFFRLDGHHIVCRPMKGTSRRGMTIAEDRDIAATLKASPKDRAENVMITDMIRNDLGRIARAGTVQVDALYDIEKYPTLWQMTSTVSATTDAGINQILTALFPCSSITGAPKKSAIGIIADLEDEPRGIYTGAIGWFGPGRQACFSVAIRTAVIDKDSGRATYGTGGGIVWDSEAHKEYDECLLKARVLGTTTDKRDYHLLETLRWDADDGYFLLGHHLERLKNSAEYFDFPFDCGTVEHALDAAIANVDLPHVRVRLLLARDGTVSASAAALDMRFETPAVRLAAAPVDPQDPFLYHKTTRRNVYDQALRGADGADDVLLWNPDGYITETAIANVIVRQRERMVTPPVSCGLLAGTYRRWLLENSDLVERPVHIDQLADGDEITLINSVRRAYTARLRLRPA